MHVAERLLARGDTVIGVDDVNGYYDPALKEARLARLALHRGFRFHRGDLSDRDWCTSVFGDARPTRIIHLAAQAGVRYSFENPSAYVDSNLVAFVNVLEAARHLMVQHLVYASSSSVYGANTKAPFAVSDRVDAPVSLYAATKRANELMAHVYALQFGIPTTGLRFFTVYGPWGRPDMAYYGFTRAILADEPIRVFNRGQLSRDFTYIDDIVDGVVGVLDRPPREARIAALYNIGASTPIGLLDFIRSLEAAIGKSAQLDLQPMQPGDVPSTFADVADLEALTGTRPSVPLDEGLRRFVAWYREYHRVP